LLVAWGVYLLISFLTFSYRTPAEDVGNGAIGIVMLVVTAIVLIRRKLMRSAPTRTMTGGYQQGQPRQAKQVRLMTQNDQWVRLETGESINLGNYVEVCRKFRGAIYESPNGELILGQWITVPRGQLPDAHPEYRPGNPFPVSVTIYERVSRPQAMTWLRSQAYSRGDAKRLESRWSSGTTTSPNQPVKPPAGWYPDPYGRFEWRYWDSANWTRQVMTGTVTSMDSLP
jgi:hypothetical protein